MVGVVKHWKRLRRGSRGPIPGNIQGQTGFQQHDLLEDVPVLGREFGVDDLPRSLPTLTAL